MSVIASCPECAHLFGERMNVEVAKTEVVQQFVCQVCGHEWSTQL